LNLLFEAEATLGEKAKIRSMPKIVPAGRMDSVEKNEEEYELSYSSYCGLILYDLSLKEVVDCL
jgi:hypothetical protein